MVVLGKSERIASQTTTAKTEYSNIEATIDGISTLAELRTVIKRMVKHIILLTDRVEYLEDQLKKRGIDVR